jgi:response regulator RpfG family c-di-GMP phosphodiesterase
MLAIPSRAILLVEDEVLEASDLARILKLGGYSVIGPAGSVAEALVQIMHQDIDAAVLNTKVGQELTSPVLDVLASARVPFLLVSSHPKALIPIRHRNRPYVSRPCADFDILERLGEIVPMARDHRPGGPKNLRRKDP